MYISLFNGRRINSITLLENFDPAGPKLVDGPVFESASNVQISGGKDNLPAVYFIEEGLDEACWLHSLDGMYYYDGMFYAGLSISTEVPSAKRLVGFNPLKADMSDYDRKWVFVHSEPNQPDMYCMGLDDSWSVNLEDAHLFTKLGAQTLIETEGVEDDELVFDHQRSGGFGSYSDKIVALEDISK